MKLSELEPSCNSKHDRKKVGRGPASGHGKTCGRGHKGQKSRSGKAVYRGFEGGQMPLVRRLPKRGFTPIFKRDYELVNVFALNKFRKNAKVTPQVLQKEGLTKNIKNVRILGKGKLEKPLIVQAHYFTQGARQKIESIGGKVEVI